MLCKHSLCLVCASLETRRDEQNPLIAIVWTAQHICLVDPITRHGLCSGGCFQGHALMCLADEKTECGGHNIAELPLTDTAHATSAAGAIICDLETNAGHASDHQQTGHRK